jgi:hypothetical protein
MARRVLEEEFQIEMTIFRLKKNVATPVARWVT